MLTQLNCQNSHHSKMNICNMWWWWCPRYKGIINPRCGYCQLVFHSSHLLHQHKEATAHWTDDDFEEQTETEDDEEPVNWDELERLL